MTQKETCESYTPHETHHARSTVANATLCCANDFPLLQQKQQTAPRMCYLDSAASTQKPRVVIDEMKRFYEHDYANVHRSIYPLAERATEQFEQARALVAQFINAAPQEVIFTRSTTEGINMIARSLFSTIVSGDEILCTNMEHHSNFVPWQQLAMRHGATFTSVALRPDDTLDLEDLQKKMTSRTRILALTHVSNVLGTINPIQEICRLAHERNIFVIIDGAQAIGHLPVDVQELGCDFYIFSGHKMYGPEGIGVVYGRHELLERLPPSTWGGEMVLEVTQEKSTWNELPYKFEAGTPDITQAIGLAQAIKYLQTIGMRRVQEHDQALLTYAQEQLSAIPGLHILGPAELSLRTGIVCFVLDGIHPHDIAQLLADRGVCVRAGHHCAHPLHCAKALPATTRASFGVYTTKSDIDCLVEGLHYVREVFK